MKTEKLLEELENLIAMSSRVPFTSKRMIEEEDIMRIIDSINESLPLEMEESRKVLVERDQILAEAQRQSEKIIAQAKEYAHKLTEEHEVVRAAHVEAQRIVESTEKSSTEYKNSCINYAIDVLRYVEGNLEQKLEEVRRNRESLTQHNN